tara:strand:- start:4299 stop:4496 length:198 start_codon:yes stop_codon:yes gene_type:complete
MKNTIKYLLSFLIFFAGVPSVSSMDMNEKAGMEEVKKKKKKGKKAKGGKGGKKKRGFFSKLFGNK